jgi:hypothetical protein
MHSRIKRETNKITQIENNPSLISGDKATTGKISPSNNRTRIGSRNNAFKGCRTRIGSNNKGNISNKGRTSAGSKISVPSNNSARIGNNRNRGSSSDLNIPRTIAASRRAPGKITAQETGSQTIAHGSSAAVTAATESLTIGIAATLDRNTLSESQVYHLWFTAGIRASNIGVTGSHS